MKRSSTFGNAFASALKAPVQGVKSLVTRPVDTVTGAAKGIGKFFSNVGHSIFGGPSEQEEGTFKRLVGLDVAKRKFAFKFGVDPYSAYPPLQERLNEIAWAAVAGGLTVKAAFSAIPGPAGKAVMGTGAARNLNKLVSDKTPAELKSLNSGKLARMDLHESLADVFLEHPKLSPTRKTMIVGALSTMPGVENRGIFIQQSALVQTEFAAFLRQRQAGMIAGYHNNVAAVARLIKFGRAPFLQRRDGVIIGLFPVDHIAWTAGIARDTGGVIDAIAKRSDVTGGELWFEGTVSQLARRSFEAQNWVVRENVGPRLKSK